jgi:hypothetical protein
VRRFNLQNTIIPLSLKDPIERRLDKITWSLSVTLGTSDITAIHRTVDPASFDVITTTGTRDHRAHMWKMMDIKQMMEQTLRQELRKKLLTKL